MEQVLQRGIAAGLVVAVAGVIAATPIISIVPPTAHRQDIDVQLTSDVWTAVSLNVQDIYIDLATAMGMLSQLSPQMTLSDAAAYLLETPATALAIPENLITAGLAALTGDNSPNFFDSLVVGGPFTANVLGALGFMLPAGVMDVSAGVTNLFSLDLTDAFTNFAGAFNLVVAEIPETLIVDSMLALGF